MSETIADILAGMRDPENDYITNNDLRDLADRIEAAARREREAAEARQLNECVVVRKEEASEWRKRIGNTASMREALRGVRQYVRVWIGTDVIDRTMAERIVATCDAALAAPARNCDVGTADEQAERFEAECKRHEHCTPCPVFAAWGEFREGKPKSCKMIWAQMPYEGGGAE